MLLFVMLTLVCLAMLGIGSLILAKNPRDRTNQSFFGFQLLVVAWIVANSFTTSQTLSTSQVVVIDRIVMALPAVSLYFLTIFALAFTHTYQHISLKAKIVLIAVTVLLCIACATPLIAQDVIREGGANIVVFGPLVSFYLLYVLGFFVLTIGTLVQAFKKALGSARVRLQYVFASLAVSVFAIVITNLILPLAANNFALVPYGPLMTIIIVAGFAYAIIRHRLFDIRLIIARSVTYFMLLGSLAAVYGAAIFGLSHFIFKESNATLLQNAIYITLSIFMAFTFQPLRRFFEHITDRIFYRDRYDSQVVLNNFTKVLVSELELDRLLKRSLTELCESLHIQFGQIIVYKNGHVYRIEHYGPLPQRLMIAPELARLGKPMLIADELEDGDRKKLLESHGVRLSLMLRTRDAFVGYLLLGDKLSGDIYSNQDIKLLEIISKEFAVTILNAKAYAEIQEFNLNLQGRIERATKRLRIANRHLKELDRAKDEFISMASHQLRTPLTTIKGYLSMMLEGDAGRLTVSQKDFVNYAFDSSERMVNLISDLLNVSRLQAGRFLIQTKPTDLVQMIQDEVRQLQEHAKSKHISLTFQFPHEPLPLVQLDENKTRQVIMNFIDNAIYYTKEGGVTVVLQQLGSSIRFEVRDTGIGVPKEARRKLFSKFYRAENAQIVRPDGTGLGLYLAKRVVEDQGGTIIFESTEGTGSTFGFELPYNPVDPEPPSKQPRPKRKHANHK